MRAARWSLALLAVLALVVVIGAALAVRHEAGVGAVVVLNIVLSGTAVAGISLVLRAAHTSAREAHDRALRHLREARRAEAVAADLRDEVLRLQSDLARLTARVEASHRRSARGDDR